jgi:hypothetical protein
VCCSSARTKAADSRKIPARTRIAPAATLVAGGIEKEPIAVWIPASSDESPSLVSEQRDGEAREHPERALERVTAGIPIPTGPSRAIAQPQMRECAERVGVEFGQCFGGNAPPGANRVECGMHQLAKLDDAAQGVFGCVRMRDRMGLQSSGIPGIEHAGAGAPREKCRVVREAIACGLVSPMLHCVGEVEHGMTADEG